jgi:hypothetical protein
MPKIILPRGYEGLIVSLAMLVVAWTIVALIKLLGS